MDMQTLSAGLFYEKYVSSHMFIHKQWKYLTSHFSRQEKETNIVVFDNGLPVGACGIHQSPYNEKEIWMVFLCVIPSHKNRGIGKKLIRACAEYAAQHNKHLLISSYSEEGMQFLKPTVKCLMLEFPGMISESR